MEMICMDRETCDVQNHFVNPRFQFSHIFIASGSSTEVQIGVCVMYGSCSVPKVSREGELDSTFCQTRVHEARFSKSTLFVLGLLRLS